MTNEDQTSDKSSWIALEAATRNIVVLLHLRNARDEQEREDARHDSIPDAK